MWVLDTGIVGTDVVCPAKLVVFDLHTSRLLRRIEIPKDVATNSTTGRGLLVTPVVQNVRRPFCHKINVSLIYREMKRESPMIKHVDATQVYIADVEGYGLIVYNGDSFRRLTSSAFDADLRHENYTIEGQTFQLDDGILGMAISPRRSRLYFSPMTSHNLNFVRTEDLQLRGDAAKYVV